MARHGDKAMYGDEIAFKMKALAEQIEEARRAHEEKTAAMIDTATISTAFV